MDQQYFGEGSLPNKLPKPLICKTNEIFKEKGKLKITSQKEERKVFLFRPLKCKLINL